MDQFALNWNILREPSEPQARQNAKKLLEAVRNHESTRKLGRNPNLQTMMALIFRIKARLPHGRALLYDDIAEAYLESIDWYRGIRTRLEPLDEKKRWLGRVAFEMQRQRTKAQPKAEEILASSDQVCRWIAAAMSESGPATSAEDAALVVADLARRSGLVLPRGHDRFAFLHLSFQEYFAAGFLQDQIISPAWLTDDADAIAPGATKQDLHNYARDPVWRETLVFLVELLFNGNRRWLKPTRDCLFGRDFAAVTPDDPLASGLAVLLAHLAVDPHSGFTDAERQQAIAVCCRFEVTGQKRAGDKGGLNLHKNEVARVLFLAEPEYRTLVAQSFVEAVQTIELTALHLDGTSVSDLSPLARMSGLTWLSLNGTPVSDLLPLAGLANLQVLIARDSSVSDEAVAAFRAERVRRGLGEVRIHR